MPCVDSLQCLPVEAGGTVVWIAADICVIGLHYVISWMDRRSSGVNIMGST